MNKNKITTERIYYLDSMRAILMMLGVVLHSAQVFSPEQSWKIYSEYTTPIAEWMVYIIHVFRMPAFFIISGYFAIFTLHKYNIEKFLKVRILRIIIPLVITAITLNSLQAYVLTKTGWIDFELISYIKEGQWVSHLWFLINLIVYFLIFSIGYRFFHPVYKKIMQLTNMIYTKSNIFVMLSFMTLFAIALVIMISFISKFINVNGIINLNSILYYISFFIFGVLLYSNKEMQREFIEISPIITLPIIVVSLYSYTYFSQFEGKLYKLIYVFFDITAKYYISALCFYLFYKFTNRSSKIFYFLSNASYTVYLFHQVFVIVIGLLLIKFNIGGFLGLMILMISVSLLSVSVHYYFISRVDFLSFLFNGKRLNTPLSKKNDPETKEGNRE